MPRRPIPPAGPPPNAQDLREAALEHLARFAATEAGLLQVLHRRADRWARRAGGETDDVGERDAIVEAARAAKVVAREVVARLAEAGAVNDAAFAESRTRSLMRAGNSRRAVTAHLVAKGVDVELARSSLPDDPEQELAAALVLTRRKRIGAFRAGDPPDAMGRRQELMVLARAGFSQSVATQALAMEHDEAEALVIRLRR